MGCPVRLGICLFLGHAKIRHSRLNVDKKPNVDEYHVVDAQRDLLRSGWDGDDNNSPAARLVDAMDASSRTSTCTPGCGSGSTT